MFLFHGWSSNWTSAHRSLCWAGLKRGEKLRLVSFVPRLQWGSGSASTPIYTFSTALTVWHSAKRRRGGGHEESGVGRGSAASVSHQEVLLCFRFEATPQIIYLITWFLKHLQRLSDGNKTQFKHLEVENQRSNISQEPATLRFQHTDRELISCLRGVLLKTFRSAGYRKLHFSTSSRSV